MTEKLIKIVQTLEDDETGAVVERTFNYEGDRQTTKSEKVLKEGKKAEPTSPAIPLTAGIGTEGLIAPDVDNPTGTHINTAGTVEAGAIKPAGENAANVASPVEAERLKSVEGEPIAPNPEDVRDGTEPLPHKGKLPSDFPYLADLNNADIHTYGQLSRFKADYTKIDNIGDAKAKRIAEALGE